MPRMTKKTTDKGDTLKEVNNNSTSQSTNKLHKLALAALKVAKRIEASTPTRAVISEDRKTVTFVKIVN